MAPGPKNLSKKHGTAQPWRDGGAEEQPLRQRGPLPPKRDLGGEGGWEGGEQYGPTAMGLECKGVFEYQTLPHPPVPRRRARRSTPPPPTPPSLMVCSSTEGAAAQNKYK